MWALYVDKAADIRAVCYVVLVIAFLSWGAVTAIAGHRWLAAALVLTGLYWVGSLHYALSRDPMLALVFTTPVVVALAVCCVGYIAFNRNHE